MIPRKLDWALWGQLGGFTPYRQLMAEHEWRRRQVEGAWVEQRGGISFPRFR